MPRMFSFGLMVLALANAGANGGGFQGDTPRRGDHSESTNPAPSQVEPAPPRFTKC